MKDPYRILGVSPDATEEQIRSAYHSLARRYHPDNYANDPAAARRAEEKMKEINEAYDSINRLRSQHTGGGNGQNGGFAEVRQRIRNGLFADAELILDRMPPTHHSAEWHYLKALVLARRGWQNDALREIEIACTMDPGNSEYQEARNYFYSRSSSFGGGYGGPRRAYDRPRTGGECNSCDMCTNLICADCCCECVGFDLIRCI